MKTHSKNVVAGSAMRIWMWSMLIFLCLSATQSFGRTVCKSTGGTMGTPLNWSSSGSWTCTGSGAPLLYVIQSGHCIYFDVSNSSPYIDTVLVYGDLIMGNNVTMTFTSSGAIGLIGTTSTISGGSNNTQFAWDGTGAIITGPFTASEIVSNGPRYASATSTIAASGVAQASFIYGTLPVHLIRFTATCAENEIKIQWSTAMEIESDRYEVLMSENGKDWEMVHTVRASGDVHVQTNYAVLYSLENKKSDAANNYYFTLKSVDKNGNFTLSEMVNANCDVQMQTMDYPISISPNPAVGDPVLSVSVHETGNFTVDVYSETGKICNTFSFSSQTPDEVFAIILQGLDPGIYRARMVSDNAIRSTSFVKL